MVVFYPLNKKECRNLLHMFIYKIHQKNGINFMNWIPGYKDQNLALRWVNENIANFCGDPKKVTLFGQSSGGVAVDFHMLSEMSKGKFLLNKIKFITKHYLFE